jgi:4-amino-4-deoxy-L-arabinose transferase-like glycosyltransferase
MSSMTSAIRPLLRRQQTWVVLIFLLAFVLRLGWSFYADVDPRNVWRFDMSIYDYQTEQLASGNGYIDYQGGPTAHWPPGYPMTLAPLYYLFHDSTLSPRMLNVVLGSATVALLYLLGSRLFDRRVGLAAALLLALFPNQVFFASLTLTEVLFTTLLVLILLLTVYLMLGPRAPPLWRVGLTGAVIGYAALVRGEGLFMIAFILPALLLRWRSWRRVLTYGAVLLVGMAVIIAPWTVRNAVRMKSFILISTSGTEALWVGHHPGANGQITTFDVGFRYETLSNPGREVKTNDIALHEALSFIRHHPVEDLKLIPSKLYFLYKGDGSSMHWIQLERFTIPPRAGAFFGGLASVYYWIALLAAAAGARAWFSLREPGRALLVGAVVYWTLVFGVVFFGDNRFHFPIIPILSLWAAASLVMMGDLLRKRRRPARA